MNKKQSKFVDVACSFGCIICGGPAQWHHVRAFGVAGKKAPDTIGFPLCADHHTDGGFGTALHASQLAFEGNFGTEAELLEKSNLKVFEYAKRYL